MVALVVGVIFYGQELTQDGVMNINGAIFLFLTNMTFQNVFSVANVGLFYDDLRIFNIFLNKKNAHLIRRYFVLSYRSSYESTEVVYIEPMHTFWANH